MTFRFDDVCINCDIELHNQMTDYLFERFPDCEVIWAVSPAVIGNEGQRVYPKIFNAFSNFKAFYMIDRIGIPPIHNKVKIATHGLFHVDHRLLTKEEQIISILASRSLIEHSIDRRVKYFVPPFNKWNEDTEAVCKNYQIELIKWEGDEPSDESWMCMEYNKWDTVFRLWYLHAREFTFETFKAWFENGS